MATFFWMSKKQWTEKGFPVHAYDLLASKGYGLAWKGGGGITMVHKASEEAFGFAKIKGDNVEPDLVFRTKYKEVMGIPLVLAKLGAPEILDVQEGSVAAPAPYSPPVYPAPGSKKPPKKKPLSSPVTMGTANADDSKENLTTVNEVGVMVPGTQKPYRVFLISDDVNIAYRYQSGQLAIRAEKFTPEAKAALNAWGVQPKSGTRPYASCHLQVPDKATVVKTLGSLAASVLTGAPAKQLAKDKI